MRVPAPLEGRGHLCVPGEVRAHFSAVSTPEPGAFASLEPGESVVFTWEEADQDGYAYRAPKVRRPGDPAADGTGDEDDEWATMRLVGPEALYRSAARLARGTRPTMRELLLDLRIPRTYLHPEADGPLPGADALTESGVTVVPVPDCGRNVMLDTPEAFVRATATALTD